MSSATDAPAAVAAMGQAAGMGAEAEARTFGRVAQQFGRMAGEIGQWADKAAAVEGERAGRAAGLDPEFRVQGDTTIYGLAYERAGLETAKSRLTTELAALTEAAFDRHPENPAGLQKELAEIRRGFGQKVIPELAPDFEVQFNRQTLGLMRQASRAHLAAVRTRQTAALSDDVATRLRTIEQQAWRSGLDADADQVLAGSLLELRDRLRVAGPDGRPLVDPKAAGETLRRAEVDVATSRIKGAFDRLEGLGAKERFISQIEGHFSQGGHPLVDRLDVGQYEALVGNLRQGLARESAAGGVALRSLARELSGLQADAEEGIAPTAERSAALASKLAAIGTPELVAETQRARDTLSIVRSLNAMPLPAAEAAIDAERARLATTGSADARASERVRLMERWLEKAQVQATKDPLGWGARIGLAVPDLDPSSGQALAQSLAQRVAVAEEIGARLGREPVYVRPQEKQALAAAMRKGGQGIIDLAGAIVSGAGERSPRVLGELAKEAPELAAIGQLALTGGSEAAVTELATHVGLRGQPGWKGLHSPEKGRKLPVIASEVGRSFSEMPGQQATIEAAADAIYQMRAQRRGLQSFDNNLYAEALQDAAGRTVAGGRSYGGFGAGPDGELVWVPPGVRTNGFAEIVDALRDDDVTAVDRSGRPLRLATLKAGRWVAVEGPGRYAIQLGEEPDGTPRYALGPGTQRPLVVDLNPLLPKLRQRRRELFIGADNALSLENMP